MINEKNNFYEDLIEYNKSLPRERKILELYRYIKNEILQTPSELSSAFGVSKATIKNYLNELSATFAVEVEYNESTKKYEVVFDNENLSKLKVINSLLPVEIITIITALNDSPRYLYEDIKILQKKLISHLRKEEQKIVKKQLLEDINKREFLGDSFRKRFYADSLKKLIKLIITNKNAVITLKHDNLKKIEVEPIRIENQHCRYYLIANPYNSNHSHIRLEDIVKVEESKNTRNSSQVTDFQGFYGYDYNEIYKITLKVSKKGRKLLENRRRIKSITIVEATDEYDIVEFNSNSIEGVKLWLIGFAEHIEVIAPEKLKDELLEMAQELCNLYS